MISIWFRPKETFSAEATYISSTLGNCGIACVAMLIDEKLPVLLEKYKRAPYYDDEIGWYHYGLEKILRNYRVVAEVKKYLLLTQLKKLLENKKLVIVSLAVPHPNNLAELQENNAYQPLNKNQKNIGHLCLLRGFNAEGFYLNDPRNLKGYAENVFVPYSTFVKIFKGNGIVVSSAIDS